MRSTALFVVAFLALSTFDPMKCARQDASPPNSKLDIIQYDPQASLDQFRNLEKAAESVVPKEADGNPAQPEQVQGLTSSCWCDKQRKEEYEARKTVAAPNQAEPSKVTAASKAVNVITVDLPDGSVGVAGVVVEPSAVEGPEAARSSAQATDQVDELPAIIEKQTTEDSAPEGDAKKDVAAADEPVSRDQEGEEKEVGEPRDSSKASKRGKERGKKAIKEEKKRSKRGARDSSKKANKDKGKRSASSKEASKKTKKSKGDKRK